MIINRYLITEVVKSTVALLMVLILIGLSNEFVIWLSRAAEGMLPASLVLKVVWLNLPILVCILLPMAFFFGILFAFGRLYADSEMVVLHACGYGLKDQLRAMVLPTLIFSLIAAFFNLVLSPISVHRMETLIQLAQADVASQGLTPGRFQSSPDGRYVMFAESISKNKTSLNEIFIAERPIHPEKNPDWGVISSARGFRQWNAALGAEYFVIQNGYRYQGSPGDLDFMILKFDEYGIKINNHRIRATSSMQSLSTPTLWGTTDLKKLAELNWRLAMTVAIAIVAILAVPISRVAPRKGKYSTLVPGMIVVIAYINCLVLANTWLKEGVIPARYGMWWVHSIGLFFGILLIAHREQWWQRFRMKST